MAVGAILLLERLPQGGALLGDHIALLCRGLALPHLLDEVPAEAAGAAAALLAAAAARAARGGACTDLPPCHRRASRGHAGDWALGRRLVSAGRGVLGPPGCPASIQQAVQADPVSLGYRPAAAKLAARRPPSAPACLRRSVISAGRDGCRAHVESPECGDHGEEPLASRAAACCSCRSFMRSLCHADPQSPAALSVTSCQ